MKDKKKYLDKSWKAKMVEKGLYKDSEITSKEKRVEEMGRDIRVGLEYGTYSHFDNRTKDRMLTGYRFYETAKILYKQGYRKLSGDSVVLSKEEYEQYKKVIDGKAIMVENLTDLNKLVQFPIEYDSKMFDDIADFGDYIQEQSSKETAEKFARDIFKHITTPEVWGKLQQNTWLSIHGNLVANKHIYDLLIEPVAKQFGVEIKE